MHAELIAILEALSYIDSISHNNFLILTDSRSALQLLYRCTSPIRGIPIAYSILDIICKLRESKKNVTLQWVPSHVGIKGNEVVDKLAKEATIDGVDYSCEPFYTEVQYKIRERCYKIWQEYFNERSKSKGIWYATIQPSVFKRSWIDKADMGRHTIATALRLRSGHIPLNKFAFLMRKVDSPNCTVCNSIEDVYHIIMECRRNEPQRHELAMTHNKFYETGECNSVLANPTSEIARALYKLVNLGIKRRSSLS
ncbi:hypothetical protein O3G_MSEX002220 [Manduca sexta]|uniref:RNase H type-1 domain-containing protein n=1 Tax=Manduca sexta TaxID=7130 RepID=A0A921YNB2_MANSE|nr:hypothetical protein O3G_MSEX002220 [Manduca sexta]